MKSHAAKQPFYRRLTSFKSIVVFTALGLLLLLVQVNSLLTSSFRIELFGVEILEVRHLENRPAAVTPADETDPFIVVERMPELIGGLASIQQAVRYPAIAKRAGIEGRVVVQFIVDEHGRVTDPQIVRGIGGGCDEEALRVVRQARFRPGTQRGRPAKVKMSLPLTFRLG